jgi:hypothetical protein
MRLLKGLSLILMLALMAGPALAQTAAQPPAQLPPGWAVTGTVAQINPQQNSMVVNTPSGSIALTFTGQSVVRGQNNNNIPISGIHQGDQVMAAFTQAAGANNVVWLYRPAQTGAGAGGAAPAAPAPGAAAPMLNPPQQLGPPLSMVEGLVDSINPAQNSLVVKTEQGTAAALATTPQSIIIDANLNPGALANIKQGQRVLVTYTPTAGQNQVKQVFILPVK